MTEEEVGASHEKKRKGKETSDANCMFLLKIEILKEVRIR